MDLPPFLTQSVKTQNPCKGELSHGVVEKDVHQGVQAGRWRREFRQGPGNAFSGNGKPRWPEGRIAALERKIGQQALEVDFLKGGLQRIEEKRMLQAVTGNPRSTGKSKKK